MKNLKDYRGYALITGASAGIGREFARLIAAEGVNCIVVARRKDRLIELQEELQAAYGVDVRVVAMDLGTDDCAERLLEATGELPVGILVNNAGFGDPGPFAERSPAKIAAMIKLKCLAPALLTRAYLPPMIKRGTGAMIMVSSALGLVGCPYEATYAATKAFGLSLGEALWGEFEDLPIDICTICPASTETEFLEAEGYTPEQVKRAYKNADSAEYIARITLEGLGKKPVVMARDAKLLNNLRRFVSRGNAVRIVRGSMRRLADRPAAMEG